MVGILVLRWVSSGIREHLNVQLVNKIFYLQKGIPSILVLQSIGICCIPPINSAIHG